MKTYVPDRIGSTVAVIETNGCYLLRYLLLALLLGCGQLYCTSETHDKYVTPYSWIKDSTIRVFPTMRCEDTIINVPIYEFKEDTIGNFLRQFTDSLLSLRTAPIFVIDTSDKVKIKNLEVPSNCILIKDANWTEFTDKCRGVILNASNTLGIIYDDSELWISKLHLYRTDKIMTLMIGKSFAESIRPPLLEMTTSIDLWSVLDILPNGKVDPLLIYNMIYDIQGSDRLTRKFDWIETFYKRYNLPPGCGYYYQPKDLEQIGRNRKPTYPPLPEKL